MGWNINAAIDHLRAHANAASMGLCARYTRQAIEAGGVMLERKTSAKDYGSSLKAVGFVQIDFGLPLKSAAFYNFGPNSPLELFQSGDVVIFEGTDAITGGENGHMQMFDGNNWISDFIQTRFSPGSAFDQVKFKVYRHRDFLR